MRAVLSEVFFTMKLVGNAGFNNQSSINFGFEDQMQVLLGDEWNISQLPWGRLLKMGLTIPSGTLAILEGVSADVDGDDLIIRGDRGIWDGKQMGLLRGMSGYGSFDAKPLIVEKGTYMLPEDTAGSCAPRPLDFSKDGLHYVTWPTYHDRHLRHLCMFGTTRANEDAASVAPILHKPAGDRRREERWHLEAWWSGIRSRAEMTEDTVISHAMRYAAAQDKGVGGYAQTINADTAKLLNNFCHAVKVEEGDSIVRSWVHYGDRAFEYFIVKGFAPQVIDARALGEHLPIVKELFKNEGTRRMRRRTRPIFEDPGIQAEWDSEEEDYSLDDDADYDEDYAIEVED